MPADFERSSEFGRATVDVAELFFKLMGFQVQRCGIENFMNPELAGATALHPLFLSEEIAHFLNGMPDMFVSAGTIGCFVEVKHFQSVRLYSHRRAEESKICQLCSHVDSFHLDKCYDEKKKSCCLGCKYSGIIKFGTTNSQNQSADHEFLEDKSAKRPSTLDLRNAPPSNLIFLLAAKKVSYFDKSTWTDRANERKTYDILVNNTKYPRWSILEEFESFDHGLYKVKSIYESIRLSLIARMHGL
jgi:hypothetical protein